MIRVPLAAGLAAVVAAPAAAQQIVGRADATFSLREAVARDGWVRIATPNGAITVTRGTGDRVEVRAEKTVRRGSVEDVGFVVRRASDGLTVCAVYEDADECDDDGSYLGRRSRRWSDSPRVRIDFTVTLPAGLRVKAGTGNGDVSVTGGGPEVVAASGNGRVDVSGAAGSVRAATGNGRVTVEDAGGPVHASSGSGDIRIRTAAGPVSASTGNGSIEATMDRVAASAEMRFSTGNGRIVLTVPEGFGAELEGSTGNGNVSVDFPIQMRGRINRSRIRGTIGDGGGRLVLTSGNGDLVIRRGS